MSQMQLEANVLDGEGEVIEGYFYADTDAEAVINDAIERACEDGLDDKLYKIVVVPFDASEDEMEDPLAVYYGDTGDICISYDD